MTGLELLSVTALLTAATAVPVRVDVAAERAALFRADKEWSRAAAARDVYVTEGFALPGFSIQWETSAFEVSAAGDMAYGWGTNVVMINDPQGKSITARGRAVTVWRKGTDGSWRCAVDIWNAGPGAPPSGN